MGIHVVGVNGHIQSNGERSDLSQQLTRANQVAGSDVGHTLLGLSSREKIGFTQSQWHGGERGRAPLPRLCARLENVVRLTAECMRTKTHGIRNAPVGGEVVFAPGK